jgi:exopolysaccharide biosynthesis WecB/TagA/CpsF family protein
MPARAASAPPAQKRSVLGVLVDPADYATAVDRVVAAAREGRPLAVSALAVHGVMTGYGDAEHRARLNRLDLVVPDGQPVRWALNLLHGAGLRDRVYGPTLMLRICERAAREGLGIYLYGSTPEVLEKLSQGLRRRFPELAISGAEPSRFRRLSPAEKAEVVERVRGSGARIVFVGLGCPRQEVWAYEYRDALSLPVIAVGAAFDFHAGLKAQAPRWMQDRGLEWLFRFASEPRRLWRRYLLLNPAFVALLGAQYLGLRDFPTAPTDEIREQSFG